jgi:hypothetical protein
MQSLTAARLFVRQQANIECHSHSHYKLASSQTSILLALFPVESLVYVFQSPFQPLLLCFTPPSSLVRGHAHSGLFFFHKQCFFHVVIFVAGFSDPDSFLYVCSTVFPSPHEPRAPFLPSFIDVRIMYVLYATIGKVVLLAVVSLMDFINFFHRSIFGAGGAAFGRSVGPRRIWP